MHSTALCKVSGRLRRPPTNLSRSELIEITRADESGSSRLLPANLAWAPGASPVLAALTSWSDSSVARGILINFLIFFDAPAGFPYVLCHLLFKFRFCLYSLSCI